MDKRQALQSFWGGFGIPAYEQHTVPENAQMPYITYNAVTGDFESTITLSASIWYRSKSWAGATKKELEIEQAIGEEGYKLIEVDNGYLWIRLPQGIASQSMDDPNDRMIRRIYVTLEAEYLTTF